MTAKPWDFGFTRLIGARVTAPFAFKGMPPRYRTLPPRYAAPPPRALPAPKLADGFYRSPEWRGLAAAVKRERGARCQRCGSGHRVIADHVIELRDGGAPLDASNLELLCQACHNAKTATARARRSGLGGTA
ncbi:HNH endonuclease signature motif containing protein [uncultured Amaricoccus sp.]|uniref:HNH endonuclease n=2 Tax=Amaricoccus TaxID=56999 RepID=UPI0026195EEB|nr:HNH endonuclease signature motif containing protein [uncultured Amaricoccus sp.]